MNFIKTKAEYIKVYIKIFKRKLLKIISTLANKRGFYVQSEMDISNKSLWKNNEFISQTGGFYIKNDLVDREIVKIDSWDNTRKDMLILLLRTIETNKIPGYFAELGVYKGWTAKLIHSYCPNRKFCLFDTFEGFTDRSVEVEESLTGETISSSHFADTSLESVKKYINSDSDNINYHVGYFPDSLPNELKDKKFAFVHLDADLYEPIYQGLDFFYPRMSENGIIVIHDYNAWVGSRKAVDKYCSEKSIMCIPMPDKSGSAIIIKVSK